MFAIIPRENHTPRPTIQHLRRASAYEGDPGIKLPATLLQVADVYERSFGDRRRILIWAASAQHNALAAGRRFSGAYTPPSPPVCEANPGAIAG